VSKDDAVTSLHDFEVYCNADPHYVSHTQTGRPKREPWTLPDEVQVRRVDMSSSSPDACYDVIDKIPGIAARFLPGIATSTTSYQIFLLKDGVLMHVNAALDVVLDRQYSVREGGSTGLQLVERVDINCSKLFVGVVRAQEKESWSKFHEGYIKRMGGQVGLQTPPEQLRGCGAPARTAG
jgi:hypothetical protein